MSPSKSEPEKENAENDSFVEAFKSIPPIPKQKNQLAEVDVVTPKHQPDIPAPVDKRKHQSEAIDAAYRATLQAVEKRKHDSRDLLTPLMTALSFNSKALAMNREGDMTQTQQDRFNERLLGVLMLGVIVAFLVCVTFGAVMSGSPAFIVFMLAVFTGVVVVIGRSEIEARRKNFKGGVVSYTGRVRKIGTEKHWQVMVINYDEQTERIFTVWPQVYSAFVDGETYTLYLPVKWEQFILSAEPVSAQVSYDVE